jgi:hypothetical protein
VGRAIHAAVIRIYKVLNIDFELRVTMHGGLMNKFKLDATDRVYFLFFFALHVSDATFTTLKFLRMGECSARNM